MLSDKNLYFLKDKIQDLQSAIFYNFSTSVLKLPPTVVNIAHMDEIGQLWFYVHKPVQSLAYFDHEFPAQLQLYKKGKQHRIQVHGKAVIVDDPEELNSIALNYGQAIENKEEMFLMKVKIINAEYYEPWTTKSRSWFTTIKENIYKWIYNEEPSFHPYNFGDAAA